METQWKTTGKQPGDNQFEGSWSLWFPMGQKDTMLLEIETEELPAVGNLYTI